MMTEPRMLTTGEVAERLRVSEDTVRKWLRENRITAIKLGGPRAGYRITEAALAAFVARSTTGPAA